MRRLLVLALVLASTSGCSIRKVRFTPLTDGGADRHDAAVEHDAAMAHDAATGVDAARLDAGGHDAGRADAAAHDAAVADAGGRDAAGGRGVDAGPRDAGSHDAHDASTRDAATADACGTACTCATNLVPVMTGPTTPSGTVTTSGAYDGTLYPGWMAFDASPSSIWVSAQGQTPAWIGYAWSDGPRTVLSYAIDFTNGTPLASRAPSAWTFEGSIGSAWIVLDTRTSQVNWQGTERRVFTVASPGSYQSYRLYITDDNDPGTGIVVISIARLELLGCP